MRTFAMKNRDFADFVEWVQNDKDWAGSKVQTELSGIKYAIQRVLSEMRRGDPNREILEELSVDIGEQRFWEKLDSLMQIKLPD